jgi:hypothetical protein
MLILGYAPWKYENMCWYVRPQALNTERHPVEIRNASMHSHGRFYFSSQEEAARAVCKYYGVNYVLAENPLRDG